jgi:hypothetical protein
VSFTRLRAAHWVAFLAALALLFVTAMDWYSTTTGDEARRIEELAEPEGAAGGQVEREVQQRARETAEGAEKNAWQADGAIDRLILIGLLLTAALAVVAGFAAARNPDSTALAGLAGVSAAITALLVTYRIFQEPGFDASTTVKAGAPVALLVLGVIAIASAITLRTEPRSES